MSKVILTPKEWAELPANTRANLQFLKRVVDMGPDGYEITIVNEMDPTHLRKYAKVITLTRSQIDDYVNCQEVHV